MFKSLGSEQVGADDRRILPCAGEVMFAAEQLHHRDAGGLPSLGFVLRATTGLVMGTLSFGVGFVIADCALMRFGLTFQSARMRWVIAAHLFSI
ncbi:MAG: hypothetical protein ACK4RZ_03765 [Paracoccaceae bacterium]